MCNNKIIGIVGGVGPYAGLDLCRKIFDNTKADKDQDHLCIALLSMPGNIEDRTAFLLGNSDINPAFAISKVIIKLEHMGAGIIGIPCNASHAPQIFNVILDELKKANSSVKLINLVEEVAVFIKKHYSSVNNVGVLAINGTYKSGVYKNILKEKGFNVIMPDEDFQNNVIHDSVYNPGYGIKARVNPVTKTAKKELLRGIKYLQKQGTEAVVLGCTEMPLAITDKVIGKTIIIDSTLVLARALIKEALPEKLKAELI